jgi:hypothetical protein
VQRATKCVAISVPVLGCITQKVQPAFPSIAADRSDGWLFDVHKRHRIALALLSFLILGAAFLQNITAGVVVFITGMIMAPAFVSGLLICVPVWWAQNARTLCFRAACDP